MNKSRLVLAIVAAVAVGAIGWLVWPTKPGPVVLHAASSHYAVTATVDSTRIGMTSIAIDLTGGQTLPSTVDVQAVMPMMGHSEQPVPAVATGNGHYRADGVTLMMTGTWQLLLSMDAPGGTDHLTLPLSVTG